MDLKEASRNLLMVSWERDWRRAKKYLESKICKNREDSRIQSRGLTEADLRMVEAKLGWWRRWWVFRHVEFWVSMGHPVRDASRKLDLVVYNSGEVSERKTVMKKSSACSIKGEESIWLPKFPLLIIALRHENSRRSCLILWGSSKIRWQNIWKKSTEEKYRMLINWT